MEKVRNCPKCGKELPWTFKHIFDLKSTSDKIYITGGVHPKIAEAQELIERAQKLEREVKDEQRKVQGKLKCTYDHKVIVKIQKDDGWHSKIPEGAEYIRIEATLNNKDEIINSLEYYGSFDGSIDEHRSSVKYYRKHGILFHDGGGWMLLKDEELCSDEEWEELKKGNLEKFMR